MPTVATEPDVDPVFRLKLLRAADIATWLDVSEWRVYDLVRQDILPHVRMGRNVRFDPQAIKQWLESGGTALEDK